MDLTNAQKTGFIGKRVRIRRYVQPTLKDGDPDRETGLDFAATVLDVNSRGCLILDAPGDLGLIHPDHVFLGGGTEGRYLVTEITEEAEAGPDMPAKERIVSAGKSAIIKPYGVPQGPTGHCVLIDNSTDAAIVVTVRLARPDEVNGH